MNLKVLADESDKPWFADGLQFTCTQCGNCCTGGPGYVWISQEEIDRLAAHLKMDRDDVIEKYCRKLAGKISLKENKTKEGNYDCVFLEEVKIPGKRGEASTVRRTCTIYPVRPLQCRTWPFWDGLLKSKRSWEGATERCPGMNNGKQYSREQIEALRDAEDWPQSSPSSKP